MRTTWFVVHVAVVALLTAVAVAGFMRPVVDGEGVDIGLGFIVLVLLGLGLPWSISYFAVLAFEGLMALTAMYVFGAVTVFGSALVNVVLHWRLLKRGHGTRGSGRVDRNPGPWSDQR